ncbi:diguanylate cyclase [Aliivibrio sp. S4TY2]|uniref:diguanylate cyclase domain-containing protein n=1 Tax=unclassified Aliivibrio TaxID=2645654 RepID=UPI0023780BFE|nr:MULTISPECIES: diguanylate cyclase [unclassified Aliivibrio]MDD9155264.1 diguanylate cyclase [Aliivibrio sp. S4TY2]MDD9159184.1 diguanylate cyclase [Aliivibrio sp. S4TY1]MDD9163266.1 diguanylate cyclase [Aliivibrio sp. S4MY2]MDD9167183.1 diguanylate cyclase [Aliivibrio sp. S4MY4]MDD9184343.1 diguanylate cyclase [Aliivibrio sp. S4MY3]
MIHHWFSALPLRKKVIYPIWTLLTLSSLILGASVAHFVGITHSANLYTRTSILAQGIASNLSGALIFNDQETGLDQMNALSFDPEIIAAHVEHINNEPFAKLDNLPESCQWKDKAIHCSDSVFFAVTHPITLDNEHLGNLTVWASKDNMFKQRNQIIVIFLITSIILSVLALIFAHGLHRLIATPLLSLFHSMQGVIRKGVTNKRLDVLHPDEIGMVTLCFNDMLDNLSHRDDLLTQAFQSLEDRNHYINQVLESIEQGLLVISPNKEITYYNPAAHLLFPEIKNQSNHIDGSSTPNCVLHEFEPSARINELLEHIEQHKRLLPVIIRHQITGVRYQISSYPISGEQHSLLHIEDITTRYAAEQRQRLAETIFDQNPSSVVVLLRDMSVETKNTAFIRYFGDINKLDQLVVHHPVKFSYRILKQLLTRGSFQIKTDVSSNGEWLPCLITIKIIKNSENKVESFVVSINDKTQDVKLKQLRFEANHDALTHLANRQNAHQTLLKYQQSNTPVYILFLDLDGFKAVNDTYGHQCGDDLLKIIAQRLKNSVSKDDLVARLAGDEFLLAFTLTNDEEQTHNHIHTVLNRILDAINQPIIIGHCEPVISASIGVYYWKADENVSVKAALNKADKAMYCAKVSGKNRYHIA